MKQTPKPPGHLSPKQRELFSRLVKTYHLDDPGLSLLTVACEALDRLDQAREAIARDGITIGEGAGVRRHPALDIEKQSASIFLRSWRDLGWDRSEGSRVAGGVRG